MEMVPIMSRQNFRSSRRLSLESLEGRQMMAGNVLVSVTGGDLVITGDTQSNFITIVPVMEQGEPVPGRFFIAPQNSTRINNQTTGQFVQGVTDDLIISMDSGNDRVILGNSTEFDNFVVPDDLTINMGAGNDAVLINRISVTDDLTVNTAAGADGIFVQADVGQLGNVDSGNNDLNIDSGSGNDFVQIDITDVRGKLTVSTGLAATDLGADDVEMTFVDVDGDAEIRTGGGNDVVNLFNLVSGDDMTLDTGAGRDTANLTLCAMDELFAQMGTGRDVLEIDTCLGRRATLRGGPLNEQELDVLRVLTSSFTQGIDQQGF
jgi:hypothetical protein